MIATCATLLAVLAQNPGATVQLRGTCGPIELKAAYARPVTIDASGATVRGLRISGRNITWKGGTLAAIDGLRGRGPRGYALHVSGSGVKVSGVTFTDAQTGVVLYKAAQIRLEDNVFTGLRADGVTLAASSGIVIARNRFENARPDPPVCRTPARVVIPDIPKRDCNGDWRDGDHPDAIQMRDGVSDVLIEKNVVTGRTQGIAQMDTKGDKPLANIRILSNEIATDNYHHITLGECSGCRIERNIVKRAKGSQRKAVIRAGTASRCGNKVQDEAFSDGVCG
jgi:parallel beta-helix repeat protein